MKKILISLVFLIILTGCSRVSEQPFEISEVLNKDDGFYIYSIEDQKCYSLSNPLVGSSNLLKQNLLGTKSAYLYSKENLSEIPVLKDSDYLIIKSQKDLKEVIPVFPLEDYGYSLGLILEKDESGEYRLSSQSNSIVTGSSADGIAEFIKGIRNYRLISIGNELFNDNLVSDVGTLVNLEEDQNYELVFMRGTIQKKANLNCDTKILVSNPNVIFKVAHKEYTENGFAILDINELEPGYYYISLDNTIGIQGGIFYKEGN